jgi:phosphatidylglycerophosphate synthase
MEHNPPASRSTAASEARPKAWSYFGTKLRASPATSRRILTWPNLVTALRMPFIPAMVVAGLDFRDGWMMGFVAINYALDMLDGHVARLLNQASRFGALFDKILDAISMVSAVAMLAYRGTFPLWLFGIIAVKYAILFSLGTWLARRKCDYPQVYFIPRVRLGFGAPTVAGIIGSAILPWPGAREIAQWATAALLVGSTLIFVSAASRARPRIAEPTARAH